MSESTAIAEPSRSCAGRVFWWLSVDDTVYKTISGLLKLLYPNPEARCPMNILSGRSVWRWQDVGLGTAERIVAAEFQKHPFQLPTR